MLERAEAEQILVAGDDQGDLRGSRTGEHVVTVGIAADRGWQWLRFGQDREALDQRPRAEHEPQRQLLGQRGG